MKSLSFFFLVIVLFSCASLKIPTDTKIIRSGLNNSSLSKKSWDTAPEIDGNKKKSSEALVNSSSKWDLPPKEKESSEVNGVTTDTNKWKKASPKEEEKESSFEFQNFSEIFSEEKRLAFDSQNKIYILTKELETKIHLFPKINEFKSAVIIKTVSDSMFLHIETVPKKLKIFMTETNLQKLREKVDIYLN